jgi:hypothetical protein
MKKTFHSKIDPWLTVLTGGMGGFILFISWCILQDPFPTHWFLVIFLALHYKLSPDA